MSQDKMETDYLWIRNNPALDADVKLRTHGYHYLYEHVPNKKERLEMIYRSMGRAHDWELEKFRAGKKFPDKGNKRRFVKNVLRFFKHPIGYTYWKTFRFRAGKGRAISTLLLWGFFFMILRLKQDTVTNSKKNFYILKTGKNVESTGLSRVGYYDQQNNKLMMPLAQMLYYDLPAKSIIINPCRNQNYRKYFEMRKKYNIKTFL